MINPSIHGETKRSPEVASRTVLGELRSSLPRKP
jgi:hypothetical protein